MKRDTLIPIRMTKDEIAILRAAAKRAGLGLGPWLRMLGLREAEKHPRPAAGALNTRTR